MDIVIGEIRAPDSDSSQQNTGSTYTKAKKILRDRRKNKFDRRKSVRDGIAVSLSFQNDRRVLRERRKVMV